MIKFLVCLPFFRVSMHFIKHIRISQERAETEVCAEIDRPAAIFDAREIGRIRVAEFSATQGNEARVFLLLLGIFRHLKIIL